MLATVGPASEQQEAAHLPRLAKYLLIAAFLASYNPQKYDRRLFLKRDSSATTRRGGRKAGQIKETHGNERQQLLGPKVFALDRMIAIFHSILDEPVDVTVDFHTQVGIRVCFTSSSTVLPVPSQIASLFALNMLQRTSEDGVEKLEGVRGKCNISYEFVQRLAKDLGFELGNYLYNFTE